MTDAPERIWIKPCHPCTDLDDYYVQHPDYTDFASIGYIRADLVPQWRPIETAPRDGTRFMGFWGDIHGNGCDTPVKTWFETGNWHSPWEDCKPEDDWAPTHWMPLPDPPTIRETTDEMRRLLTCALRQDRRM